MYIVGAILLSGVAACFDVYTRKIPNWLTLGGLLILWGFLIWEQGVGSVIWPHVMSLAMGCVVGVGFFYLGFMGGGDGKLLMLVSSSVPFDRWLYLMLCIALAGGVQALLVLIFNQKRTTHKIPYGVAIFVGTLVYFAWVDWYFF